MKKNYLRAVLSFAVAGMMALSMFTKGTSTVKAEDATVTWATSKSKTVSSTTLDDNNQVKVTLSLPAKQEKLVSDVVFVLDSSSCENEVKIIAKNILQTLDAEIVESGAKVNIGFVVFKGNAMLAYPLTDYEKAKNDDLATIIAKKIKEEEDSIKFYNHRTNLPAGLACAEETLDNSNDGVANTRKHMILVSDGATYLFCKDSADTSSGYNYTSALTRVLTPGVGKAVNREQSGTLSEWNTKYMDFSETDLHYSNWAPSDWTTYLKNIGISSQNENMSKYNEDYFDATGNTNSDEVLCKNMIPFTNSDFESYDPIINVEESFYQANKIYQQMKQKGYDCNAYTTGNVVATAFTEFMNYLAGGEAQNITKISNDIFYLLSAGSVVTDEMGNMSNQYEFNFVNDAANLVLTVGNDQYTATKVTTLPEGVTAMYLFNNANASYDTKKYTAPFILEYYDGSNGGAERIKWYINTNVSEFAPVQLTYTEQMTNYQTTAGTYTAYTNNDAMLYPIDSNNVEGVAETFERPSITFTVRTATPKGPDQPSATTDPVPTTAPADRPTTPTADDRNERPNTPNTGDQTNAPLAAGVLAVALLTCGLAFFFKKKYSN